MASELFLQQQGSSIVNTGSETLSITKTGVTAAAAPTPGFGDGSFYFDGDAATSLEIDFASTSLASFGTGEFTIDLWVNVPSVPSVEDVILLTMNASTDQTYKTPLKLYIEDGGDIAISMANVMPANVMSEFDIFDEDTYLGTIEANTWTHLAITRKNNKIYLFRDGNLRHVATETTIDGSSTVVANPTGDLQVGRCASNVEMIGNEFTGYMANIRIDANEAYWDRDFALTEAGLKYDGSGWTDPAALTSSTDGNLFLIQQETSVSNIGAESVSFTAEGLTIGETPTPGFDSGSYYFDGSGMVNVDIKTGGTTLDSFGTGEFTIDFWVNPTSVASTQTLLSMNDSSSSLDRSPLLLNINSSGLLSLNLSSNPNVDGFEIFDDSWIMGEIAANTWTHIAITRHGDKIYLFKNGSLMYVTTDDSLATTALGQPAGSEIHLGRSIYGGESVDNVLTGYISNFRMDTDEAYWNGDFSLTKEGLNYPTDWPLPAKLGEVFLEQAGLEVVNNGSESTFLGVWGLVTGTTPSPGFGYGSYYFDGTPNATLFFEAHDTSVATFGTGEFTIDFWINPSSGVLENQVLISCNDYEEAYQNSPILVEIDTSGILNVSLSSNNVSFDVADNNTDLGAVTFDSWNHIAITRKNNNIYLFKDGVLKGTIANAAGISDTPGGESSLFIVGAGMELSQPSEHFKGYMSNFRIDTSEAFWDSGFNTTKEELNYVAEAPQEGGTTVAASVATNVPNNIVTSQTPVVTISGTAPSNTTGVTWKNVYKGVSGDATGTEEWVAEDIPLNNWKNKININVEDDEGSVTTEEVIIQYKPNYNKLSSIYSTVSPNGNIRGKAKEGFVRPTIKQMRSSENWSAIKNEPFIGDSYGGGYYMGTLNGYRLVCAPVEGQQTGVQWKTTDTDTAGTTSFTDGYANTQAMVVAGITQHPAGNFCNNLNIGGYTDWYMPSRDEAMLFIEHLDTLEAAGAGAFVRADYYTSTDSTEPGSIGGHVWTVDLEDGTTKSYFSKTLTYGRVRAVRRVAI